MDIANRTKFAAERLITMNGEGCEVALVVVKATFDISSGTPRIAVKPDPIRRADEHYGEPGKSSIKYAADLVLFKPGCDVLLHGFAHPAKKEDPHVDVSLHVGDLRKTIRVFGERTWNKTMGVGIASNPKPFDKIPLKYELAYGGTDASNPTAPAGWARNPVGLGFRAKSSKLPVDGANLPSLEDPKNLLSIASDQREPACFGPIAPSWEPRKALAGTYDEAWQKDRMPLLPEDFDPRFFQCAPTDQILKEYVKGGEKVEVLGATPSGSLKFELPKQRPEVLIRFKQEQVPLECPCDTVVIDTERMLLTMAWRGSINVHQRVEDLLWAIVRDPE